MRKLSLLSLAVAVTGVVFAADPPRMDISSILSYNSALSLEKTLVGENGIKGCVADFNGDGYDDFILTGLYQADASTTKGFLNVYLGQQTGVPALAYNDDDFKVVGNGAIDYVKLNDGSFNIVLQGGAVGNWTNPFKGQIYNLKVVGSSVNFDYVMDLDYGGGRNSIYFLDMDGDGFADIFQGGWRAVDSWDAKTQIYMNDGTNEWFDLEGYAAGEEPIRPANNTFVVKGDLNNDGRIDLVQAVQGAALVAYFNNGDKTFTEYIVTPFALADRTDGMNIRGEEDGTQIELIDFNGDGLLDIVLSGTNDNASTWSYVLMLFKNNGDGTFTEIAHTNKEGNAVTFIGGQRGDFAIADFDGDGKQDFILGAENQNDAGAWVCRTFFFGGNGKGGFDQSDITYGDTNPLGIVPMSRRGNFGRFLTGDFNGDGKPDLITAGADYYGNNAGLRYYQNVGKGGTGIESVQSNAKIYSTNKTVYVTDAEINASVKVYNLTGVLVYGFVMDSESTVFTLNADPGIYIVKVGSKTQKIVIK